MSRRPSWLEMENGQVLESIHFVGWVKDWAGEHRFEFSVPNPPIFHGDPDLFSRLSFEEIRRQIPGVEVSHIIRGECTEAGYRDCFVYRNGEHVPVAVIRPKVWVR